MKHIIFVKDLTTVEDVSKLQDALSDTRLDFEINLERSAIIIDGRNDLVHLAKTAIREAGYTVE
ncbi:MAG TPA: hypothetical protein DEA51_06770 [Erysipelotrichaceae bacterium]|nr:hypothetical protein [Erysipelotrichaceae bacterium]